MRGAYLTLALTLTSDPVATRGTQLTLSHVWYRTYETVEPRVGEYIKTPRGAHLSGFGTPPVVKVA